ncbi:MAG: tRNA (adenosine(37)-N6)-threonylcarbamoyltransferase complex dimerization subunit type 1 TsaB, partial [Halanaerobium sp.]
MLILAIDTSTDILGLALIESGQLKGEYNLSLRRQHSEKLLPLIEQIFELLEIQAEDLDGITVAVGPGSFTGLRIGITTAKM